jgi:hypothetical protein
MISIDEQILQAQSVHTWTPGAAAHVASTVARNMGGVVDWDQGAGESWIRVLLDDVPVLILSIRVPFAIASSIAFLSSVPNTPLQIVSLPPLSSPVLTCDLQVLQLGFASRVDIRFSSLKVFLEKICGMPQYECEVINFHSLYLNGDACVVTRCINRSDGCSN